jgi:hypothetical protein
MRKRKKISLIKTILIITEGSTEKDYFLEYKKIKTLNGVTITPKQSKHSSLKEIVKFGLEEIIENKKHNYYEAIWIVYDRDVQKTFSNSVKADLLKFKKKGGFVADSYPCFELWLLSHYSFPRAFYNNQKEVINNLEKYLKNYSKQQKTTSTVGYFSKTITNIDKAVKNCSKLDKQNIDKDTIRSVSNVYNLINNIDEFK